jgi:esterase/lipase
MVGRNCRAASLLAASIGVLLLLIGAARADQIGIVLMHGKQGRPDRLIAGLAQQLESAGYLVERPTLCWAGSRIYDKAFSDCLQEIDQAVARLRSRGADAIIVGGQSLGGSAALAYGAGHDGLAGIIALVPGPSPAAGRRPEIARELDRAKSLIEAGRGDERTRFADVNQKPISVETTPRIYVSFLDPQGPANYVANTAKLRAPLLWLVADQDPSQLARDAGFDKAPAHPLNRYASLHATHFSAPDAAAGPITEWLAALGRAPAP